MKKIVVLGGRESGIGAAILAKKAGYEVFLSDSGQIPSDYLAELQYHQIDFEQNHHSPKRILEADEVVKSPGIPQTLSLIKKIREKNILISSEIDFAFRFCKSKIIAITGTNGKTTTTLFTYHLLKSAGLNVGLAGNIGESFAKKVAYHSFDWYVLEVSSFQLEDVHSFKPNVGILLNVTPDHLDRYPSLEQYCEAKFNLTKFMDSSCLFIYNADSENIARRLNHHPVAHAQLEPFTEAYFKEDRLFLPALRSPEENLNIPKKHIFDRLPLAGKHNAMNIAAAVLAALRIGIDEKTIQNSFSSFENAPHRLQKVAQINDITFINDSKATNVDSVMYALDAFNCPIVWIAGGIDKGNDYSQILPLVRQKVKALVCLGKDNQKLMDFFAEEVAVILDTQDIKDAVRKAYQLAERGDVVLLSPACSSFDLFKNYEDRGNRFMAAVDDHASLNNAFEKLLKKN
jgi:UDP-N-acetylmuramoylalanine--D-glutamate ligase